MKRRKGIQNRGVIGGCRSCFSAEIRCFMTEFGVQSRQHQQGAPIRFLTVNIRQIFRKASISPQIPLGWVTMALHCNSSRWSGGETCLEKRWEYQESASFFLDFGDAFVLSDSRGKIRGARFVGAKRDYSRDERRFAIIHLTEILVGCQRRPHALHKALTE